MKATDYADNTDDTLSGTPLYLCVTLREIEFKLDLFDYKAGET